MESNRVFQPGDICAVDYKSGFYIAQFVEYSAKSGRAVVMILAVLGHPLQGDLHHPFKTDVPLFHQRKAAAYREQVLVPIENIAFYAEEIPDYGESLRSAYYNLYLVMKKRYDEFGDRSMEQLSQLEKEYGLS